MWFPNLYGVKPVTQQEIEEEKAALKRKKHSEEVLREEEVAEDEFVRNIINRYYRQ